MYNADCILGCNLALVCFYCYIYFFNDWSVKDIFSIFNRASNTQQIKTVCRISFPLLSFETSGICSLLCTTFLLFIRGFDKKVLNRTFCYLHWYLPNLSCSEWHCSSSRRWEVSGFPGWHNLRHNSVPLLLQWCLFFDLQVDSAELHLQKRSIACKINEQAVSWA